MNPTDDPRPTLGLLQDAGFAVDALSAEQRQVLGDLSAEELELLLGLKRRLDLAAPEVEAHSEFAGGALF